MRTSLIILSAALIAACSSLPYSDTNERSYTESAAEPSALEGEWKIVAINGGPVIAPEDANKPATLIFEDGRIGANVHCNSMGTSYTAGPGTIKTDLVMSTLMACQQPDGLMQQESTVSEILRGAKTYSIASNGELTLRSANGGSITASR